MKEVRKRKHNSVFELNFRECIAVSVSKIVFSLKEKSKEVMQIGRIKGLLSLLQRSTSKIIIQFYHNI